MRLIDILKELVTRSKPIQGQGMRHAVYNFDKQPDKIIKVGYGENNEKKNIDPEHARMFEKYPYLFPKVYKTTPEYAVFEKLNTQKAEEELESIGKDMIKLRIKFWPYNVISKLADLVFKGEVKQLIELDPSKKEIYDRWFDFINRIIKVSEEEPIAMDLHDKQVGYDSTGKLKLLDF